ncbi:cyclin-K-like [Anoplophora glabripennis]|uniref:cyclin-K-like n=1 Tax=Anoplophora glabripennis TaxID=217634 RepID=UPI000C7633CA|nr:cyclin-K-like [Anoplophora glabripennis]
MPGWYYDKKELRNTPSAQDGIDYKTEMRYRKEGARLIIDIGSKINLGYNTMATGVVYYHRFYMFHSFKQFPRYVTACCCLFLAGKVEETPKKCKDIIKIARSLLTDQKFATFGEDPKEEVMTLERILLQTIKFDLQVEHPYQYLLKYAKCLKGDNVKLQKMVQMAWTFVNDSICTTLALQWEPEIIAVALMYLAGKLSRFEVVDWIGRTSKHIRWWDLFVEDVTMELLEDVCHQVLDLYSQMDTNNAPDSPPLQPQMSVTQVTPVSVRRTSNGNEKIVSPDQPPPVNIKIPPPSSDVPPFPYQTFTGAPPSIASYAAAFPTSMSAPPGISAPPHMAGPPPGPPPHITAPPPTVFPPYVNHPPPFTTVIPPGGPPFFSTNAPPPSQPHRPFYPPPT